MSYLWQFFLNLECCAPWRWHTCIETCRSCDFNIYTRICGI